MIKLNRSNLVNLPKPTERVIQFGEGNFLRAFVDYQIDILNQQNKLDLGVIVLRCLPFQASQKSLINEQDGLYTVLVRGFDEQGILHDDKRLISCITREIGICEEMNTAIEAFCQEDIEFVFSNTTEAGIVYDEVDNKITNNPKSFPARLTLMLYQRYLKFKGDKSKGLTIIPCELIEHNATTLKKYVLQYAGEWKLEKAFIEWLANYNYWCSTLVDRIVPGFPANEVNELNEKLGYQDDLIVATEHYLFFAIENAKHLQKRLRLPCSNVNFELVDDVLPYRTKKVGILNGTHTLMVSIAYLMGYNFVNESLKDPLIENFVLQTLKNEIVPSLNVPKDEADKFAEIVIKRFLNPYIQHKLIDISLNSISKVKARVVPQLLRYYKNNNKSPKGICLALASLCIFYAGKRGNETILVKDDTSILSLFETEWKKFNGSLNSALDLVNNIFTTTKLLTSEDYLSDEEQLAIHKEVANFIYRIKGNDLNTVLREEY